jgi:hypothetical protein
MGPLFGANVPYLYGDYGHDLAPNPRFPEWPARFDPLTAYRPLIEAKGLGLDAVRTWLLENAEGIVVDGGGRVTGVHPRLLDGIRVLSEAAHLHGLLLYFGLLDGNSWPREGDSITRSILADADQAARFAEHVAAKIAAVLDPRVTLGLEVVNEPESSTGDCIESPDVAPIPWASIGRCITLVKQAVAAERDVWVTAGTLHVFLPALLGSGAELTAIDVHIYHPEGGLPSRADLIAYAGDHPLLREGPLVGGELGIPKESGDPASLCNYVHNARRLGYDAAFLWKLEGDLIDTSVARRPWTALGAELHDVLGR